MTDEELIARLRKYKDDLLSITADRIEALVKESAEMEAEAHAHIELWGKALREKAAVEARAERLEAALREIESISVHSGGEVHGVTALQWELAFAHAQDVASSALKGADHDRA